MKFKSLAVVFGNGLAHVKRHSDREIELVLPLKPSSSVKASPFSHSVPKEEGALVRLARGKQNQTFLGMKKKLGGISTRAELEEHGGKTNINLSLIILFIELLHLSRLLYALNSELLEGKLKFLCFPERD